MSLWLGTLLPLAETAPPATPPKPTKRIVARQALDPPPAQRQLKPPPIAPSAPAVLLETPWRPVKHDTKYRTFRNGDADQTRSEEWGRARDRWKGWGQEPRFPVVRGQHSASLERRLRRPTERRAEAKQLWYAALVIKLREMRRYPPVARRLGQEGVVILAIEFGANGE